MPSAYDSFCDEFYVNMNLNTEMELPSNRETVLHFFEQIQRKYPTMKNFFHRDRGEFVLEEDKSQGNYRWATVEAKRICSGYVNPPTIEEAMTQHEMVTELIPYSLSVSALDCDSMNVMYGFDFNYRGNHNALIAEALGVIPAFEQLSESGYAPISYEPSIQFAIDDSCNVQCRLSIETRTTAYQVKAKEYPEDQLSVYLTARRYGSLQAGESYTQVLKNLQSICDDILNRHVIENVLAPLKQTIAIK